MLLTAPRLVSPPHTLHAIANGRTMAESGTAHYVAAHSIDGADCGGLKMSPSIMTGALLMAAGALLVGTSTGEAKPVRESGGTVKVCSLYGKGCVTAPTRPGQFND